MHKKHNYNIGFMYGAVILSIAIFVSVFYAETALLNRLNEKTTVLNKYNRISKYIPIEKGIIRLKADKERLEQLYEKLRSLYDVSKSVRISKLKSQVLKGELPKVENSLRAMAKEAGMELPDSLGLDAYKGKASVKEKVNEFYSKMYATSRLITMALNSKILKIDQIQVGDAVVREPIQKNDDIIYLEVPITIVVTSSSKELMNFLYQLSYTKDVFVVKNINAISSVTSEGKEKKMSMAISFINFLSLK